MNKAFFTLALSLIVSVLMLISGCGDGSSAPSTTSAPTPNNPSPTTPSTRVEKVDANGREHGYNNLRPALISSQDAFDTFIRDVNRQEDWNDKDAFFSALNNKPLDFDTHNLVIITSDSSSGSISIDAEQATEAGDQVYIAINKGSLAPGTVGTADMAYYGFFYRVNKSVHSIRFNIEGKDYYLTEKEDHTLAPKECTRWFDGCNQCSNGGNGLLACTRKACPGVIEAAYCIDTN